MTAGATALECKARELALSIIEEGISAADPRRAIARTVRLEGNRLYIRDLEMDLTKIENVYVVGMGKASGSMAEALERILGEYITEGVISVPQGTASRYSTKRIKLCEGGHPIPNEGSLNCARRIMELAEEAGEDDLVICLISGGGSALATLPADEISIDDMMQVTKLLLRCGADIKEVNVVRKHLSRLKGGWLAKAAYPALLVSLIISDVVGDDLGSIASGPTSPDPSTFEDAMSILKKYDLWDSIPERARRWINLGVKGLISETPKPGDPIFEKVHNIIIASNIVSLRAMAKRARDIGLNTLILTSYLEGEAREVGKVLASIIKEVYAHDLPINKPAALIAGGETTVTVRGRGKGGRNQELALSAARAISGLKGTVLASIGSDGIDGVTDAAGALVDGYTVTRALEKGLKPEDYLLENDSFTFFKRLGGSLIYTGPTGTNVNDFIVAVILSESQAPCKHD